MTCPNPNCSCNFTVITNLLFMSVSWHKKWIVGALKRVKCMSLGLLKLDASALLHVNNVKPSGVSAVCLFICRTICRRVDQYAAHEADRERERDTHRASLMRHTLHLARSAEL